MFLTSGGRPGVIRLRVMRLLGIAFRNLLRARRRRNALAGGTMALGTAALILGSGLSDGIARQLTDNLVSVQTGEIMVVKREEGFVRQNSPFDAYSNERIPESERLMAELEQHAGTLGIVRVAPYLHARGTAIASNRSTPAGFSGSSPRGSPNYSRRCPRSRAGCWGTMRRRCMSPNPYRECCDSPLATRSPCSFRLQRER